MSNCWKSHIAAHLFDLGSCEVTFNCLSRAFLSSAECFVVVVVVVVVSQNQLFSKNSFRNTINVKQ